jgi:hypothetical protein
MRLKCAIRQPSTSEHGYRLPVRVCARWSPPRPSPEPPAQPGCLNALIGSDIAAAVGRDLDLPPGTSGRFLPESLKRVGGRWLCQWIWAAACKRERTARTV